MLPQKFDVGHFDFTDKDQRTTILKQKMQPTLNETYTDFTENS